MQQTSWRSESYGSKVQMSTGLRHVICPLGTHSECSSAHNYIVHLRRSIRTSRINIKKIVRSPHSVFVCFAWIWEQTAIISLYNINWLVFITETECLLRGTDWIIIYNSTFCPHSVFMYFVWIWGKSAIISLYSINRLVFIIETECLLRGTDWIFIYI